MRFIVDENVAISVVNALRNAGHDVKDVKEEKLYGISDKELLVLATKEKRIIITHDKDFLNMESGVGIILLRLKNQNPRNVIDLIIKVLNSKMQSKITNNVIVVSESQIVIYKN